LGAVRALEAWLAAAWITEVSQFDSSGKKKFKVSRRVEFFDDPDSSVGPYRCWSFPAGR
jgi:hypothetical protein